MKTLRYLLSMIAVVSVQSLSAQTPNYGKPYKHHSTTEAIYAQSDAQIPAATMGSANSEFVHSGSTLPMAAQTGVTTTYDKSYAPSRPRRGLDDGDDDIDKPGQPFPLGDVMWPMMMLALAFAFGKWIAKRTKPLR